MNIIGLGQVVLSFAFVLGLMLGLAWLARYFRLDERLQKRNKRHAGALFIDEVLYIDPRRRLVVVGHKKQRFLVLLSTYGDVNLGPVLPDQEQQDVTV